MKWEDFRPVDTYDDRLPPGFDRSIQDRPRQPIPTRYPAGYAPTYNIYTERPELRQTKIPAKDQALNLMTPLEQEQLAREQKWRRDAYAAGETENPTKPRSMGLPSTKTAQGDDSVDRSWIGVSPDYPDRMEQRDPHPSMGTYQTEYDSAYSPRARRAADMSLSSLDRPPWAQQFRAIMKVDPYDIGIGDPATARAYLQAQQSRGR